jgi:two-component system, OmpR family, sensor histidine kinase TctE
MTGSAPSFMLLPNSIFGRLRLLLATVFAAGAIVALGAARLFSTTAATEAYDQLLISSATQISEAIAVDQGGFSVLPPDSAFETLAQSQGDRFFFAVRAPDGALLTGRAALRAAAGPPRDRQPTFSYIRDGGDTMRTVTLYRLIASPSARGWCSVIVAQSLEARHRLVVRLMLRIGAITLFVATLGFVASLEAVRRTLRPFDRIGQALAARRAQDTGPLEVDSPRETQALVEMINGAFHRLDERLNKLQNFAGVAAHQIRTPLSALGAQTQLLLSDETAHARRARIERIQTHLAKLSRLTHQLLGQAMVSYRTDRIPHQRIELVELVRQVLRDAIPESLDRDLAVEFESDEPIINVIGDNVTLREALVNLVSNAVTHGAKSLLHVRLKADREQAIVYIADDGPGIPRDLWESASQPFRIPRTDGEGAGLGLSIAAEVAKAHAGSLALGRSADGLFEIAFILARVTPESAVV